MTSSKRWTGLWFTLPFIVVFILGFAGPILYALYLSLFQDRIIGGNTFVGLAQYAQVLTDPEFLTGLLRVTAFLLVQVPVMIGLALILALALDTGYEKLGRFFRTGIFVPYAIPSVVAVLMWGYLFGDKFGLAGQARDAGLPVPDFLSGGWMMFTLGNIVTWQFVGYNMLILFAALRAVPTEQYEAADIDGAGEIRKAWSLKVPALKPAIGVTLLFSIVGSFQLFAEPSILKNLAPSVINTSYTPNMYVYHLAFNGQQINYSAAVAIVMGIVTVLVAAFAQKLTTRNEA